MYSTLLLANIQQLVVLFKFIPLDPLFITCSQLSKILNYLKDNTTLHPNHQLKICGI